MQGYSRTDDPPYIVIKNAFNRAVERHGEGGGGRHLDELEVPVSWDPHQGNWGRGNLQFDIGADCPLHQCIALQWGGLMKKESSGEEI